MTSKKLTPNFSTFPAIFRPTRDPITSQMDIVITRIATRYSRESSNTNRLSLIPHGGQWKLNLRRRKKKDASLSPTPSHKTLLNLEEEKREEEKEMEKKQALFFKCHCLRPCEGPARDVDHPESNGY